MANYNKVIMLAITLIIVAIIFPIALGLIAVAGDVVVGGNATNPVLLSEVLDPTVLILLTVLLPIIAIIAVVMYFLPKSKGN